MMLTTPALINFLQQREGFRKHAYDDKHPNRTLTADTVIEGKLTIGYGTTRYPDGTPVKWNDTVSQQEALDYLQAYVRTEIEPTLENLIHTPLKGCQYDALGSVLYQFGAEEVSDWRLIRRINKCEDWEKVALEWVDGTVMWMGEPRFWARRISELFMYFDLNWRAGANVPVGSSVIEALEIMGVSEAPALALPAPTPEPEPVLILDKPLPMEAKVERPIEELDPTPETPLTTEDLNYIQYVRVGGKKPFSEFSLSPAKLQAVKPNYKPELPEKVGTVDMKVTTRFKGEHNRQSGIDMQKVGGGAAITATTLGSISQAMGAANKTTTETQTLMTTLPVTYIVFGLLGFAALYFGIGWFRRWYGANQRYKGEVQASQYMH